ncbi:ABC transporter permease [Hymenobacter coccineus]|uniref:ABC transporter permease n=1 Tax=Hymenobacter coccineus TaxID=1908235 RepID=UPI002937328C|nr:FtsX-like permease family protein [Hymenobacter coccineus]
MRLSAINRRTVTQLKRDTAGGKGIPTWILSREYRVTYRDTLSPSEKLTAGTLPRRARRHALRIGGQLLLRAGQAETRRHAHLQRAGAPLVAIVGGTREVDWSRVQTNFLVLFPKGVLEGAPQFHVILTRTPNTAALGAVQQALVKQFPNVSALDLGLILQTMDDILSKISFVVRFMAGFSIATGLLVLASSVVVSRYQRVRESVLLRTLGASRRQILRITLVEYALLGLLASLAGILLSVLAAWALATWVFDSPYTPNLLPLLGLAAGVAALTAAIGLFNSRDVLNRPPLEVLRAEG